MTATRIREAQRNAIDGAINTVALVADALEEFGLYADAEEAFRLRDRLYRTRAKIVALMLERDEGSR
jgi:hypothetical protein